MNPESPLNRMTIAGWEAEREAGEAVAELGTKFDFVLNRYGSTWACRPLTLDAAEYLRRHVEELAEVGIEHPPNDLFGVYVFPVSATEIVDFVDELLDAGFRLC